MEQYPIVRRKLLFGRREKATLHTLLVAPRKIRFFVEKKKEDYLFLSRMDDANKTEKKLVLPLLTLLTKNSAGLFLGNKSTTSV